MRDTIVALVLWALAFCALALDMRGSNDPRDALPPAWTACVWQCEKTEPWDRGQGCIDMECNPLLTSEEEE